MLRGCRVTRLPGCRRRSAETQQPGNSHLTQPLFGPHGFDLSAMDSAANACDGYWLLQIQGKPDEARQVLQKVADMGIPLPPRP